MSLSDIPTNELRAELFERDKREAEEAHERFRAAMRDEFGVCEECGAEFTGWSHENPRDILLCGLFGHEPGNYGFEYDLVVTCANGHSIWRPGVRFYDKPMPL